jgi:hypothetical protein
LDIASRDGVVENGPEEREITVHSGGGEPLAEFRAAKKATTKTDKDGKVVARWTPNTINRMLALLRKVLNDCATWGYPPPSTARWSASTAATSIGWRTPTLGAGSRV